MAEHNILGKIGEEMATQFLLERNYVIRHRNWKSGKKELDIIAEKNGELIVTEVKTRRNTEFALPQDAVDEKKIRKIITATDLYIKKFALDMPVRFDIITIIGMKKPFIIEHIQNAFYPPIW